MYINVVVFNVHTASAAVLVVAAACLGLGHAFAGVLLVLLLLTYSRTRMLVAGLEAAVWLLLVNRRAERTALVPRRHRWPWAVAGCFPIRPARVRPRSPSCGGGRARAARTRGSASLPCGGARFRFGTVRGGMRRVGARSTRAAPGAWRCGAALRAGCASTPHTVGGAGTSRTGASSIGNSSSSSNFTIFHLDETAGLVIRLNRRREMFRLGGRSVKRMVQDQNEEER